MGEGRFISRKSTVASSIKNPKGYLLFLKSTDYFIIASSILNRVLNLTNQFKTKTMSSTQAK